MPARQLRALGLSLVTLALLGPLAGSAAAQQAAPSLYERLGKYDALAAVTDDFLGRLAGDPTLSKFFVGHGKASQQRIRQLVVDQLCAATGGPCIYIGREMKVVHAGMGITAADWDVTVAHLVATLDKFKVPAKEKAEVLGAIGSMKGDIVDVAMMK